MKTQTGACLSLLVIILSVAYSFLKLEDLLNRENPLLITNDLPAALDDTFSIPESDFMLAFTLEDWLTGVKDDPRYIQWIVHEYRMTEEGDHEFKYYPTHKCTDEEFERFYPVE